jgi:hypothetical protein
VFFRAGNLASVRWRPAGAARMTLMRCSQRMETRVHVCRETDGVAVVARIMRDTAERSARIFRAIASREAMIIML